MKSVFVYDRYGNKLLHIKRTKIGAEVINTTGNDLTFKIVLTNKTVININKNEEKK